MTAEVTLSLSSEEIREMIDAKIKLAGIKAIVEGHIAENDNYINVRELKGFVLKEGEDEKAV